MAVTINDIARKAGVSNTTVSLALKNHPRITKKTCDRIAALARELGYIPNLAARNLRHGRSKTIGFVINEITSPFYAILVELAQRVARENGYQFLVATTDWDRQQEEAAINQMIAAQVQGIIVCLSEKSEKSFSLLKEYKIPHIAVDTSPAYYRGAQVVNDLTKAGQLAAEHLIENGCKSLGLVSGSKRMKHFSAFKAMQKGFALTIEKHGFPLPKQNIVEGGFTIEDGINAFQQLKNQAGPIDGIFCISDLAALGVIEAAEKSGHQIGSDLAVMGIDDLDVTQLSRLSLTSISQPFEEIATIATNALIEGIENNQPITIRTALEPKLVVRSSSTFNKKGE